MERVGRQEMARGVLRAQVVRRTPGEVDGRNVGRVCYVSDLVGDKISLESNCWGSVWTLRLVRRQEDPGCWEAPVWCGGAFDCLA